MSEPVFDIPFSGGIDQFSRLEFVDSATAFPLLENTRQHRRGGAEKRYGYKSLGNARLDGSTRTVGRRLMAYGDQLCTIDDTHLDVYVPSLSKFVPRSRVPEAGYRLLNSPDVAGGRVVDVVYMGGFAFFAHIVQDPADSFAPSQLVVVAIDVATGAVILGPQVVDTYSSSDGGNRAALVACGTSCVAALLDTGAGEIRTFQVDTTALASGWSSVVNISGADGGMFALARLPSMASYFALAFTKASGASRISLVTYTIAASLGSTASLATTDNDVLGLDLSEQGGTLWVGWGISDGAGGGVAKATGVSPSAVGTIVAATATIIDPVSAPVKDVWICSRENAGDAAMMATYSIGGSLRSTIVRNITTTAGTAATDGQAVTFTGVQPVGRPWPQADRLYAPFTGSGFEIAYCDWTPPTATSGVAMYLRPIVSPIVRGLYNFRSSATHGRTSAIDAESYVGAFSVARTGITSGAQGIVLDFIDPDRWSPAEHHGGLCLSGGVTSIFDGTRVFESGFLSAPTIFGTTIASGSLTLTNGRRYVAVYVETDATGNLHISGVSNPSASTGPLTSKQVTVGVLPLVMSARGSEQSLDGSSVQILLYATADGEEPYHLIATLTNDPNGAAHTFVDQTSVATVSANALLYGSGDLPGTVTDGQPDGPQDHRAPPGLSCLTSYNGMLCGIAGSEVWFSSQPVYGEAIWWSPIFSTQFDTTLTGLFSMDGSLYATTKRGVFGLTGSPPNDTGTDGGLGAPQKLSVDRGCVNARSIVVTSQGAMFLSEHGLELFRSGSIQPIGDLVQNELDAYPVVTSAAFDATPSLVRVTLAAELGENGLAPPFSDVEGTSGGGRDIVFDIVRGIWVSADRKFGSSADQPSQDAAIVTSDGVARYAWIAADGVVYVEDPTTKRDPGPTWVSQAAETGWVHISGLQGEQFMDRVLLLAERVSDHALSIEIAFDYGEFGDPKVFTATQLNALTTEWIDREIAQTTSQAVRVRIGDAQDDTLNTGNGEGAVWINLTFSGQRHNGAKRTSGAQRGG